jgi:predicted metal-dependent HD superfamily phosphohydrolase
MLISNLTDVLWEEWQNLLKSFPVELPVVEKIFQLLVKAYCSPERHYHNLEHIYDVLTTIHRLQEYTQNLAAVKLAAWFHDVVYDTMAKDNEERSAEYAGVLLSELGISATTINMVNRLILNTKHAQTDVEDADSQVLLDADLAILGATPEKYQRYARAIRQEYDWVTEIDYILGRQQVLDKFYQRQQIYLTPLMFEQAENSARVNIKTEIENLQFNLKKHP